MILQLGIDPIHFGIVLVVTNNVAMLTPPLESTFRGVADSGHLGGAHLRRGHPLPDRADPVYPAVHLRPGDQHMAAQPYGVRAVAPAEALLYGSAWLLRRADSFPL